MNTNKIFANDVPLGMLLYLMGIVLYFFAWRVMGIDFFEYLGVLITLWCARFFTRIGYLLVKGMHVDIS